MRVLVTGGGGFLGSHLVVRLEEDGHEVTAARRADYDLTTMDDAARLFDETEPELVFHLAAEVGGIGANRENPGRYWYANLMMGAHVLEQARIHGTGKLVMAGTVCSYPKFTSVPFLEDDLWDGYPEETNAPYGVAKKAVLVGAQAYREQYGLNTIFLLPTNLYGPRDNFDLQTSHVIPALIRKMIESPDEIVLWGDGTPTREYLYVDDCVDGVAARGRALRRAGARQPRHGRRDVDPRDRRDRRRGRRLHRHHPLGRVDAERPAATIARLDAGGGALRLQGADTPGRGHSSAPWPGTATGSEPLRRPERLLVLTVGVQWLVTVGVALWATRSGSVYGDPEAARATVDAARGVAHGSLPTGGGPLMPLMLAPLARVTTRLETVSSVVTVVNVVVLAPIASYCLLEIGRRIAGRLFAALAAAIWLLGPIVAVHVFATKYHGIYINDVLPVIYGLTVEPAYPAMVLSLLAAVFALRAVAGARRAPLLAGLFAAAAIACAPMAAGVAGGTLAALAVARRWRAVSEAAVVLVVAVLPTLLWRYQAPGTPTITLGHPSFDRFQLSMANVREFFWSNRLLQWFPVAGAIGMFRLLRPAVALMGVWIAVATVFWVATVPPFDRGRFFIGLVPGWPAYALLVAAIPALVPTLVRRLGDRVEDDPPTGGVSRAAGAALLVPILLVAALFVAIVGH